MKAQIGQTIEQDRSGKDNQGIGEDKIFRLQAAPHAERIDADGREQQQQRLQGNEPFLKRQVQQAIRKVVLGPEEEGFALSIHAGAAPDLRMPSADVARAGAVRHAEAAARARLAGALAALPLGGGRKPTAEAVERAVGRARLSQTDYQSNGGAMVRHHRGAGQQDLAVAGRQPLEPTRPQIA